MNQEKTERPGVGLIRILFIPLGALFSLVVLIFVLHSILLVPVNISLVICFLLHYPIYSFMNKFYPNHWIRAGYLEYWRHFEDVPVYRVRDQLANAMMSGLTHRTSFIVVSSALLDLLNVEQVELILEHEMNHIHARHDLVKLTCINLLWIASLSAAYTLESANMINVILQVPIILVGLAFVSNILKTAERAADRVSNPETYRECLLSMQYHNRATLNKPQKKRGRLSLIYDSHPPTDSRGKQSSSLTSDAANVALFTSAMSAVVIIVTLLQALEVTPITILVSFISAGSILITGTFIGVINFLFAESLLILLRDHLGVENIDSTNALNGFTMYMALTTVAYVAGVQSIGEISFLFVFLALLGAIYVTSADGRPRRRSGAAASATWIISTSLYLVAYLILIAIVSSIA